MMSLHRSMHSSQMNTDGPAMSLRTSCWFFPQKEQCRALSSLEPFFSGIGFRINQCVAARRRESGDRPASCRPAVREETRPPDTGLRLGVEASALVVTRDQDLVHQTIR